MFFFFLFFFCLFVCLGEKEGSGGRGEEKRREGMLGREGKGLIKGG